MIYPENFESKIGFDQVKARVVNYCETSMGRQQVERIALHSDKAMIEILLSELDELRQVLDNEK